MNFPRFYALLSVLLLVLIASEFAHSREINVNPTSSGTAPKCGSAMKPCRTLKAALKVAVDGDVIVLSAGTHLVSASIKLNKNIEVTIKGKGRDQTILKLSAGVMIELFQVNLNLLDLTVSGGLGISVNAMAKVLGLLDVAVSIDLNVNIKRVKFLNNGKGLHLYAPDSDLFGVLGSINAVIEACVFVGIKDVAVVVGTRVDVSFLACKWLDNLNGVLRFHGAKQNNQCPKVQLSACVFKNNKADVSLILGGSDGCDDLLVFVGLNLFENNVAQVLLGYLDISLGLWNYQCEDCTFKFRNNQIDAKCGAFCESGRCVSPPSLLSLDVDICLGSLLDLDLDLDLLDLDLDNILPILPLPINL